MIDAAETTHVSKRQRRPRPRPRPRPALVVGREGRRDRVAATATRTLPRAVLVAAVLPVRRLRPRGILLSAIRIIPSSSNKGNRKGSSTSSNG